MRPWAVIEGTIAKNAEQNDYIEVVEDNDSEQVNHREGHDSDENDYAVDTHQGTSYVS